MSLRDLLQSELAAVLGAGPHRVNIEHDGKHLTCDLEQVQPLACEFRQLAVASSRLANVSMADVERISSQLSAKLNYLLEPIGPIERDQDQCVVQMRSNPPQQGDDGTSYYELLVRRGGELALCRFQKQSGSPRQKISAVVTREVLLRLAEDFETAF